MSSVSNVTLEFEELEILKKKKRWNLYFVVVVDHPTEADKVLITRIPSGENVISLKPEADNKYSFVPESSTGDGADGLFVLEKPMPEGRRISVDVYLRHSRKGLRNVGNVLQDIKTELGTDAFDIVNGLLKTTNPWLVAAKSAVPLLGGILSKIKDRDLGFVNMGESFGTEFETQTEQDRTNRFSTGEAEITWTWSINN